MLSLAVAACDDDGGNDPVADGSETTAGDATTRDDVTGTDATSTDTVDDATSTDATSPADIDAADGTISDATGDDASDVDMVGPQRPALPMVEGDGELWTWHAVNDGATWLESSGEPCASTQGMVQDCFHAGMVRVFDVPELASCDGVSAADDLGAFTWSCDDASGSVRMFNRALDDDARLLDLIDVDGETVTWRGNALTVTASDGTTVSSTPSQWYANPLVDLDATVAFPTISPFDVLVARDAALPDNLPVGLVDNLALVGDDGVTPTLSSGRDLGIIPGSYFWIEGRFGLTYVNANFGSFHGTARHLELIGPSQPSGGVCEACLWDDVRVEAGEDDGFSFSNSAGSTLRDLRVDGCVGNGLDLRFGAGVEIDGLTVHSPGRNGVDIGVDDVVLRDVTITRAGDKGMLIRGDFITVDGAYIADSGGEFDAGIEAITNFSRFFDITLFNSGDHGFWVRSATENNIYVGITAVGNGDMAIDDGRTNAGGHVFSDLTLAHNVGLGYATGGDVLVQRAAIFANGGAGLHLPGQQTVLRDIASTDNIGLDVDTEFSGSGVFEGVLRVTDPATSCGNDDDYGLDPGCTVVAPSTAIVSSGSLDADFVGLVASDSVNGNGASGAAAYGSIDDWSRFEHPLRGWARDGDSLVDRQGACRDGDTCRIVDLSLTGGAGALAVLPEPVDGNDVVVHRWRVDGPGVCGALDGATWTGTACETTMLRNARELTRDGVGNDNGLCESGEACVHTPNIGAYQGHGELVSIAGIGTGGAIENVDLYRYAENGR